MGRKSLRCAPARVPRAFTPRRRGAAADLRRVRARPGPRPPVVWTALRSLRPPRDRDPGGARRTRRERVARHRRRALRSLTRRSLVLRHRLWRGHEPRRGLGARAFERCAGRRRRAARDDRAFGRLRRGPADQRRPRAVRTGSGGLAVRGTRDRARSCDRHRRRRAGRSRDQRNATPADRHRPRALERAAVPLQRRADGAVRVRVCSDRVRGASRRGRPCSALHRSHTSACSPRSPSPPVCSHNR